MCSIFWAKSGSLTFSDSLFLKHINHLVRSYIRQSIFKIKGEQCSLRNYLRPTVVAHSTNSSPQEVEAEDLWVQGHLDKWEPSVSKTRSKKKKKKVRFQLQNFSIGYVPKYFKYSHTNPKLIYMLTWLNLQLCLISEPSTISRIIDLHGLSARTRHLECLQSGHIHHIHLNSLLPHVRHYLGK